MEGVTKIQSIGYKIYDDFCKSRFPELVCSTPNSSTAEIIGLLSEGDKQAEQDMKIFIMEEIIGNFERKKFTVLPGDILAIRVDRVEEYYE